MDKKTIATAQMIVDAFNFVNINIPGTIKPGQGNVEIFWEFNKLNKEAIRHIHAGCGCTAQLDIQDTGVKAVYTDGHQAAAVATGPVTFTKSLTVFLHTETSTEPLWIKNAKGADMPNPDVPNFPIWFNGVVQA